MRIGIIGTENSHADHIISYLNVERRADDIRVVALSGGRNERNDKLSAIGGIEHVVDDAPDLLGLVDAVIITDRHGDLHREHALPFLAEGLPVLVDKPLACSTADARAIVAAAREYDAPLTSSSAVRWLPDTDALAAVVPELGPTQVVITSGPADPASPYGGIFFYGIHPVDVALRLVPGALGEIRVEQAAETLVISAEVGTARVIVNLVNGQVPFHGVVIGRRGIASVSSDWTTPTSNPACERSWSWPGPGGRRSTTRIYSGRFTCSNRHDRAAPRQRYRLVHDDPAHPRLPGGPGCRARRSIGQGRGGSGRP